MLNKIVYISSDDRSGSTMLELLLANHTKIFCPGELHNLPAYLYMDRSFFNPPHDLTCMCGELVSDCSFWKSVENNLKFPLVDLKLREEKLAASGFLSSFSKFYCSLDYRWRRIRPKIFKYKIVQRALGYSVIAKNYFSLYEAIAAASGKSIVLDSSKWPYRFSYLSNFFPDKVKVILLYRDPKAVVYSKIKRKEASVVDAAKMWAEFYGQMRIFSENIPNVDKISVHYEDICANPVFELKRLVKFLGIPFEDSIINLKKKNIHHIGGSPSKLSVDDRVIKYDDKYKEFLTAEEIIIVDDILTKKNIYDFTSVS